MSGTLRLLTVDGDGLRFEARIGEHVEVVDGGSHAAELNPVQQLLASIAACEAMDVISLLRKKRQKVTSYEVVMSGERAAEHPRRFLAIELLHRVTGQGVQRAAVDDSLRLSREKYCSVYHCIRPDLPITNRVEILEG